MFEELPVELVAGEGGTVYRRGVVEKYLPGGEVTYIPLPPVYAPRRFAQYMMAEFPAQVLAPGERRILYLRFPIDIGVLLKGEGGQFLVDTFTLARVKYALYCDPRSGVLARWWRSEAYSEPPSVNPDSEGVMALEIVNGGEWAEVSRAVFNCGGAALYYSSHAAVKARVTVGVRTAETLLLDEPPAEGMARAPYLEARGDARFTMRCGL